MNYTYQQEEKKMVRHKSLKYAVNLLTTNRSQSCCVNRGYVRNLYDYFTSLDETQEKEEAKKIDVSYVAQWEKLHDACIGIKRAEDLVVCYFSDLTQNHTQ